MAGTIITPVTTEDVIAGMAKPCTCMSHVLLLAWSQPQAPSQHEARGTAFQLPGKFQREKSIPISSLLYFKHPAW